MRKIILGVLIENRFEEIERVQSLLTEFGCIIKTRLGLHQQAEYNEACTEKGLLILEMVKDSDDKARELKEKLSLIEGVEVKSMEF